MSSRRLDALVKLVTVILAQIHPPALPVAEGSVDVIKTPRPQKSANAQLTSDWCYSDLEHERKTAPSKSQ